MTKFVPLKLTLLTMGLPSLSRVNSLIPTLWSMLILKSDWPSSGTFMMYVPNAKTAAARTYANKHHYIYGQFLYLDL